MAERRGWTLRAATAAADLRDRFPPGARTSFDIVHAIAELGYPIVFKPTKNLLGATVLIGEETRGILVTTNRGLGTQRFTLAHELGHILLNHRMHFDPFGENEGSIGADYISPEEQAADAFASELLTPARSILKLAIRHNWSPLDLRDPLCIYQLALRLGVSFQAMCWSLVGANMINRELAQTTASSTDLRSVKRTLAAENSLDDPWADVWTLSPADSGSSIEAGPNDLFAARLADDSSAGYLWTANVGDGPFEIRTDETSLGPKFGDATSRAIVLRALGQGSHILTLDHKRPWSGHTDSRVEITIANYGKEEGGLPREIRKNRLRGGVGE